MITGVRFHGRGGEGVKLASRIVSRAAFLAGCTVQDSPLYGAERRGAPVVAFVRFAQGEPIAERGYIERPEAIDGARRDVRREQDLFELWRAARPAFLATVSPGYPLDLMDKVARAGPLRGPKLFVSLSSCPPGWGIEPAESVEIAKLAVETGVWPLKELRDGEVVHTVTPHRMAPLEEYLRRQTRYHHLFVPARRDDALSRLQGDVDRYWGGVSAGGAQRR